MNWGTRIFDGFSLYYARMRSLIVQKIRRNWKIIYLGICEFLDLIAFALSALVVVVLRESETPGIHSSAQLWYTTLSHPNCLSVTGK